MKNNFPPNTTQSGQAAIFVLLGLGLFLLGSIAFAIDISNLYFRRQAAQSAADAACTAGAMDLLVDATNGSTVTGNFDLVNDTSPFDCKSSTSKTKKTPAPCSYAALNGFDSNITSANASSGVLGNNVSFTWGTTAPPGIKAPPATVAPTPFMTVTVTENSSTFFASLLGTSKQGITGYAACGVAQSSAPIPILVLDPQTPGKPSKGSTPAAFDITGTPTVKIVGGPSQSIQVNSAMFNSSCGSTNCSVNQPWGSATVDLTAAGPSGNGADMGISGSPPAAPTGFSAGTGHWISPHAPIQDPFDQICYPGQTSYCTTTINGYSAPSVPSAPSGVTGSLGTVCASYPCAVQYTENGCPDHSGCDLYEPGAYPSGMTVKKRVAVFDPGLYYVTGGLFLDDNSIVRGGTGAGDGSGGATFYFNGSGTIGISSNTGQCPASDICDSFNTLKGPNLAGVRYAGETTSTPYYYGVQCIPTGSTGASTVPPNLQNGGAGVDLNGNVLLGPCTGYYGDPLGSSEADATATPPGPGEQRWFIFFQDHSATGVLPEWGGGGSMLLAGTEYFHSCGSTSGDAKAGVKCTPPPSSPANTDYFQDIFKLGGGAGSTTYVLGEIITDNLILQGSSGITMDLNPTKAFTILKADLYQ